MSYRYAPTAADIAAGRRFRVTVAAIPSATPAIAGLAATIQPGSGASLAFGATVAGQASATIRTVTGRVVRVLPWTDGLAGARTLAWDGRDTQGALVARATYSATVQFRLGSTTITKVIGVALQ
jgi:hypothetical protein